MSNYQLLIRKLDAFIRKYYLNQLIRGSLLFLGLVFGYYLLASLFEYQLYFSTTVRKGIVFAFVAVSATAFYFWVMQPLLGYLRLGSQLTHEQAAAVIGQHFSNVKDRLLNILQLRQQTQNAYNKDLIEASIDQKIDSIKLVPFAGAIDLNENRRYLKYVLPVFLAIVAIFIAAPNVFRESNERLVNPNVVFAKKAPFDFVLQNEKLSVVQFEDLELRLAVSGKTIPNEVMIRQGGQAYKMEKTAPDQFVYRFTNVQQSFDFHFEASDFSSGQYHVDVLMKPLITNFVTQLNYPAYTGRQPETLRNSGDVIIPAGTTVRWNFEASNTESVDVVLNGQRYPAEKTGDDAFSFSRRIVQDTRYVVVVSNARVPDGDSMAFSITAMPDQYPGISCEQIVDSSNTDFALLSGAASDDYGISRLEFVYRVSDEKGTQKKTAKKSLPLTGKTISDFNYAFTFAEFELQPGDRVDYYIEVWDNDGVNGPKSARSPYFQYAKPTVQQLEKQEFQNNEAIKDDLSEAQQAVKKLANQIKEMRQKLLNKSNPSWEDKQAMEALKKKHEQLTQQLEEIKDKYEENRKNQNEFKKPEDEILEKQEKIEELLKDLLSDEMQDLMKQIQDILDKMQQKNMFENLDKMQQSSDNLNKELDKMQDLFKQLQLEQKAQDIIDKLNTLAQEQQKLADQNKNENGSNESSEQAKQKQDALNKKFDELKENMKQLEQLNKENDNKLDLGDTKQEQQQTEQEMQNSSDQLQQDQKQKASQSQQKAAQQMKKMSDKLQAGLDQMQMDQNAEDVKLIRQLLENLVKLSFDQEQVMKELKQTEPESPKYVQLMQRQQDLKEDAQMIGDSLQSLGKRQFQLQNFISDEMYKLNREMGKALDNLEERYKPQAAVAQQFVMTSANNLALMLSESLDNLQMQMNQMKQSQPGSGQCKKPGPGQKPSMQQLQKELGDQLNQMKKDMQQGKDPKTMSKDFAEAVQKQAAIREALRQLKEEMSQGEKESGKVDDLMKKMDDLEKDLALKNLSNETLNRHKEIETRLLEYEKAKREQDEDEQRESKTAQELPAKLPPALEEFLQKRKATLEQYRTVPPDLKPFYKNLVEKYFQSGN